jgi:hypothetical protein
MHFYKANKNRSKIMFHINISGSLLCVKYVFYFFYFFLIINVHLNNYYDVCFENIIKYRKKKITMHGIENTICHVLRKYEWKK